VIWVWVGVAVVLVAAGALVPVLSGRDNRLRSNDEAVSARSRYNQLGLYVEDLEELDDQQAMTLLRTARERYDSTGAALAGARTEEDFLLAMRVAEEGLQAVADAYARIGRTGPRIEKQNVTNDLNARVRSRSVLCESPSRNDWVTRLYAAVAHPRPQSTVSPLVGVRRFAGRVKRGGRKPCASSGESRSPRSR
jgi:hypothetical protein